MEEWLNEQWEHLLEVGPGIAVQLISAILIFLIGKWVAGKLTSGMRTVMTKRNVDKVLIGFLSSLVYYVLIVLVAIAAIGQLGVETTSFIAMVGAAGLAVGFALQGSLANFAAGVLIIIFRPFKVGDFIDAGGTMGIVEEIGILFTEMRTPDNKKVIAPNASVMGKVITNFSSKDTRRVDLVYGVSYDDNLDKVIALIKEVLSEDKRILDDPAPTVGVLAHSDSSIDIAVRPWVNKADYWDVFFHLNLEMKKRFDAAGITIPFPQRDVHLFQEKS
ncbi:MAG: mechanosensitive ion channel [Opitutales bacterium]|nr:mechanosensitive ion channel [Opitutales bacterium]